MARTEHVLLAFSLAICCGLVGCNTGCSARIAVHNQSDWTVLANRVAAAAVQTGFVERAPDPRLPNDGWRFFVMPVGPAAGYSVAIPTKSENGMEVSFGGGGITQFSSEAIALYLSFAKFVQDAFPGGSIAIGNTNSCGQTLEKGGT